MDVLINERRGMVPDCAAKLKKRLKFRYSHGFAVTVQMMIISNRPDIVQALINVKCKNF